MSLGFRHTRRDCSARTTTRIVRKHWHSADAMQCTGTLHSSTKERPGQGSTPQEICTAISIL
eukprot:3564549-Rhodomonas_salina.1